MNQARNEVGSMTDKDIKTKGYITQEEINDLLSGKASVELDKKYEIIPEEVFDDIDISLQLYGMGQAGIVFRTKSWELELNVAHAPSNPLCMLYALTAVHFNGISGCEIEEYNRESKFKCVVSSILLRCESMFSFCRDEAVSGELLYNRLVNVRLIKDIDNKYGYYEKHEFQIPLSKLCYAVIKATDKIIDRHGLLGYFFTWNDMRTFDVSYYLYVKAIAIKKYNVLEKLGDELMDFYSEEDKEKCYYSDFREELELLAARLE